MDFVLCDSHLWSKELEKKLFVQYLHLRVIREFRQVLIWIRVIAADDFRCTRIVNAPKARGLAQDLVQ